MLHNEKCRGREYFCCYRKYWQCFYRRKTYRNTQYYIFTLYGVQATHKHLMSYDIVFYWIVHLKKNILYLKRCGYVFSMLVFDKTYVINLLVLLIPPWIRFIYIVHGYWHSVESNLLISSLWSWFKYYIRQIYIYIYIYIYI